MRKRVEGRRKRQPAPDLDVTRRQFVAGAGAAVLGAGTVLPVAAASVPVPLVPATFLQVGNYVQLKRGTDTLWEIDGRCFNLSRGYPYVTQDGQQFELDGRLAGTNIGVNLSATIQGESLSFRSFQEPAQTISIADWCDKQRGVTILCKLYSGTSDPVLFSGSGGQFRTVLLAPFRFSVEAAFTYEYEGGRRYEGSGHIASLAFETMLRNADVDPEVNQLLEGARPLSRLTLERVELDKPEEGWDLGSIGPRTLRLFFPQGESQIVLDQVVTARRQSGVLRLRAASSGQGHARISFGKETFGRDLHFGGTELFRVLGGTPEQQGLKLKRGARPFYIEAERFAAAIRLRNDCYFPGFAGQKQLRLPVELFVLHARGEGSARFEVDFRSVRWDVNGPEPGEPGLNRSSPVWSTEGTTGVEANLTLGVGDQPLSPNTLHLGEDNGASVWLHRPGATGITVDAPVLRLRRSLDALDIGLLFFNFHLHIGNKSQVVAPSAGQRGVRFHPQHLQEECFSAPEQKRVLARIRSLWTRQVRKSSSAREFGSSDDSVFFPGGRSTLIARTEVAGASRIIFKPEGAVTLSLAADLLTDWSRLRLAVPPRAVGEMPVEQQLHDVVKVEEQTSREDARDQVKKSLVQPTSSETSLELVTGLYFAPETTARFRTSTGSESPPALWTAQLDLTSAAGLFAAAPPVAPAKSAVVRAVWANGLVPEALFKKAHPPPAPDPFSASTTPQDRIEVALQSSAFGLVGKRAVTVQGVDVPNSRVRRVSSKWQLIDPTGAPGAPAIVNEGVFSPAPFKNFRARLTAFGADLDAEWQAEPLAPYEEGKPFPFFYNAFSVERYVHRTRLGSDVLTHVVYKGFLFPYGFRVALIKVTQREPMVSHELGAMMPLITRYYLIPKPVTKTYPGIYQPFDAREIPLRSARLLGERSPELDGSAMSPPPEMHLPGRSTTSGGAAATRTVPQASEPPSVFWPTLKAGGRVVFEFSADDQPTRRSLPMLFVSNRDANDPGSVREIIRYYNSLTAAQRTENHHGSVAVYAPPKPPHGTTGPDSRSRLGSTSFETDHILLKARPRMLPEIPGGMPPSEDAAYTFDIFMNGADQPPFYPVMEEATIVVPPLDRIVGSPQGLKRVGYNTNYVRHGFDKQKNGAELYLNFLDQGEMELGGNGRITGGLLRTPTNLSGVTWDNVVLGSGLKRAYLPTTPVTAPGADPPVGSNGVAPWDFSAVEANRFEPDSYFKDARILGAIKMGGAVKPAAIDTQPKLKEVYEYALGDRAALDGVRVAAANVASLIDVAITEADENLHRLFAGMPAGPPPSDVSVKRFYPELYQQLTEFASLLTSDQAIKDTVGWATRVVAQWRPVKAAVDGVIANPSPEPLREGMADLRRFLDTLQDGFGKNLRDALRDAQTRLVEGAVDALIDRVVSSCFDGSGVLRAPWFFEAMTGTAPAAADTAATLRVKLKAVFAAPVDSYPDIEMSVLGMAFTVPVRRALISVTTIIANVTSLDGASLRAAARNVALLLEDLAETMLGMDALVAAARANATAICVAAGGAFRLEDLGRLALDLLPPAATVATTIATIQHAWPELELPGLPNSQAVAAVGQASARLRTAINGVETAFATVDAVRDAVAALKLEDICRTQPAQLSTLIAQVSAANKSLGPALQACVDAARELGAAYNALPQAEVASALAALRDVRRQLILLAADLTWARLPALEQRLTWLDSVPVVGSRVTAVKKEVITAAATLRTEADGAVNATLADLVNAALASQQLASAEQRLLMLASDFTSLTTELAGDVAKVRDQLIAGVARPLIDLNQVAIELADKALGVFDSAPDLVKLFTQKVYDRLKVARELIQSDVAVLRNLSTAAGTPEFDKLLARWRNGQFGLAEVVNLLIDFFNAIMTGQIGGIFDLAAVRDAAEQALRQLIPTRVNLHYEWTGDLQPYLIFEPLGDRKLKLNTSISVDLLDASDRKVTATGRMDSFALHLFGATDLVTIIFGETTCTFAGGSPKFETKVLQVEPGSALRFLSTLGSLIGLDDTRVYLEPVGALEGLRVGYRYSNEFLDLGGVQIINFGFDASLTLYFDRREAITRFAVASRDAPCGLIVAPAYYGAGFVSLSTTAAEVIAFEIQLEFGAARALQFGPLHGFASVSAGIYLMRVKSPGGSGTRLEGFVHAIGEAHIACFGVSVNFEVKVVHEATGRVQGAATYRFSFRLGLISVGYGVTATYTFDKGDSTRTFVPPPPAALLAASKCPPLPDKTKDWLCYRDNFVAEWPDL